MPKKQTSTSFESRRWGKALKAIRQLLGWTQEQLAKMAYLSRQAISDIENQKWKTLSSETIWNLSMALLQERKKIEEALKQGKLSLDQETIDELFYWLDSVEIQLKVLKEEEPLLYQAEVLRMAREKKKLTLRELEKISGISKSVIHALESGRPVRNRLEKLRRLAQALDLPLKKLLPKRKI
jgi:transcriptional regulator with XRE-family HTH domain